MRLCPDVSKRGGVMEHVHFNAHLYGWFGALGTGEAWAGDRMAPHGRF